MRDIERKNICKYLDMLDQYIDVMAQGISIKGAPSDECQGARKRLLDFIHVLKGKLGNLSGCVDKDKETIHEACDHVWVAFKNICGDETKYFYLPLMSWEVPIRIFMVLWFSLMLTLEISHDINPVDIQVRLSKEQHTALRQFKEALMNNYKREGTGDMYVNRQD